MSKPDTIIFDEAGDFTKEQWDYLLNYAMKAQHLVRWNPNTSRMEPFKYTDDQAGQPAAADEGGKK